MKYLKMFENHSMLDTNILGDILQEITDLGYLSHVDSSWWSDDRSNGIKVTIYGKYEYDKQFNCEVPRENSYIYPDEVMDVIERLIDFLSSEKYKLEQDCKKSLDVIRNKPTEKNKNDIEIKISKYRKVEMRWDDNINGYKVNSILSLYFNQ
jgi:hypothetical protein